MPGLIEVVMVRPRAVSFAAALLVLCLLPVPAQEVTKTDLHGVVVDRSTGAPISTASVSIAGRKTVVMTDRNGRFRFKGVPIGSVRLEIEQLGYADSEETVPVIFDGPPVRLELQPDPIVLKGVQVVADRMRSRRNAVATSVNTYTSEQLASSFAFDAYDFLRSRMWVRPCEGRLNFGSNCILRRGQLMSPRVYVDEAAFLGGLDVLMGWPTSELYLIEVYSNGLQVRVYTKQFAERLAKGRARLDPVIW